MYGDETYSPRPTDGARFEFRKRHAAYFNGRYLEIKDFWLITYDLGFMGIEL